MADELRAKDDLTQQWAGFAREDKVSCIRATSADGAPSYVELQTCLEMASDDRIRMKIEHRRDRPAIFGVRVRLQSWKRF